MVRWRVLFYFRFGPPSVIDLSPLLRRNRFSLRNLDRWHRLRGCAVLGERQTAQSEEIGEFGGGAVFFLCA